jgi:hypothetical protein
MSAICTAEASKYVHAAYTAQKSTFEMIPVRKEVEGENKAIGSFLAVNGMSKRVEIKRYLWKYIVQNNKKIDINLLHFKKTYDIIPVLQQLNKS